MNIKKILILILLIILVGAFIFFEQSRVKFGGCGYDFRNYDSSDKINADLIIREALFADNIEQLLIVKRNELDNISTQNFKIVPVNLCVLDTKTRRETINITLNTTLIGDKLDYKFVDVNFDGLKDLLILDMVGYGGVNRYYNLFLNKEGILSQVQNFNRVGNPTFNSETSHVESMASAAFNKWIEDSYIWQELNLLLVKRIYINIDQVNQFTKITMRTFTVNENGLEVFVDEQVEERPLELKENIF